MITFTLGLLFMTVLSTADVLKTAPLELQEPHIILPSYHAEGRLFIFQDDLLAQLYEPSRWDLYLHDNVRTRRSISHSYQTPEGISHRENFDTYVDPRVPDRHPLNRYEGSTSWTSPEGIPFTLSYVADGSGYHPVLHKGEPNRAEPAL